MKCAKNGKKTGGYELDAPGLKKLQYEDEAVSKFVEYFATIAKF